VNQSPLACIAFLVAPADRLAPRGGDGSLGGDGCSFGLMIVVVSFPRSWALAGDAAIDPGAVQLPLPGLPPVRPP
jgi:hypothetical protein